mmetsp:Transcript_113025/g.314558  ORF Transcript_113025/g.314558 Transcript_113025/m.314558 type:complete len:277 (+) Transcript_113025:493-1323(+)
MSSFARKPGARSRLCEKRHRSNDMATSTLSTMTCPCAPVTVRRLLLPCIRAASTKKSRAPKVDSVTPMAVPVVNGCAKAGSKRWGPMMCGKCPASTVMHPSAFGPQEVIPASGVRLSPALPVGDNWMPCNRKAAQRQMCAKCLSKDRTPLSAVHLVMSAAIASAVSVSMTPVGSLSCVETALASSVTESSSSGTIASKGTTEGSAEASRGHNSCCKAWSLRCLGNKCVFTMDTFSSMVYPESSRTSNRSRRGRLMSEMSFAVQMKMTRERSKGVPK